MSEFVNEIYINCSNLFNNFVHVVERDFCKVADDNCLNLLEEVSKVVNWVVTVETAGGQCPNYSKWYVKTGGRKMV